MKYFALILCFFLVGLEVQARGIREDVDMVGEKARKSYALGMTVGLDFREGGLELDYAAFVDGFIASMENGEEGLMLDRNEAMELVQAAFAVAMERQTEQLRLAEELFLATNATAEGVIQTESGLQYIVLEQGSGPRPVATDSVIVNYEGSFVDGTVFDSSEGRDPEAIPLPMVIQGWVEGIQLMNVGSKYVFFIPSGLAYGSRGDQFIPPYSTLIFTIELLEIVATDETGQTLPQVEDLDSANFQ